MKRPNTGTAKLLRLREQRTARQLYQGLDAVLLIVTKVMIAGRLNFPFDYQTWVKNLAVEAREALVSLDLDTIAGDGNDG